jgi:hypothetical protein
MEETDREGRIERAWEASREWFEEHVSDPDGELHLRFGSVALDEVQRAFAALEARAVFSYTCAFWRQQDEAGEEETPDLAHLLRALEDGLLLNLSLHYDIAVRGLTFGHLLLVSHEEASGRLEARGYTRAGFFEPRSASARERFAALLEHALELEELLGASCELAAGEAGGESATWRVSP